jgi:hypothetical protein
MEVGLVLDEALRAFSVGMIFRVEARWRFRATCLPIQNENLACPVGHPDMTIGQIVQAEDHFARLQREVSDADPRPDDPVLTDDDCAEAVQARLSCTAADAVCRNSRIR